MTAPPVPNWYDVLDVDPAATTDEIRDAWRASIADLTPADRRFRLYNQAAEVLLDPERRAAHDAVLAESEAEPEPEPEPEPEVGPEPAPDVVREARTPRVVPTWLLVGVAVLTLLAVAATGYLWTQPSAGAVSEAASGARNAAERAAVTVLSYDYETLEEDQEAAHELMTSSYRQKYDDLFAAAVKENAPSTQTVVDVDVLASSIVRAGQDRTEVLLFVDRPTTNKVTREPVVYKDQVTLTMENVDGEWLVDDVETSPAQQ
ncbi:J domain-containing protein [Nocardioides sp. GXQ0305]|uniref:J domain-containing protein n=1 Tax=Nocardioides sp. GXQ0305 TaxID=3423912 RepID=UPI003D7CFB5F